MNCRVFKKVNIIPSIYWGLTDSDLADIQSHVNAFGTDSGVSVFIGNENDNSTGTFGFNSYINSSIGIDIDGYCWRSRFFDFGKVIKYNIWNDTIDLYLDETDLKMMLIHLNAMRSNKEI